MPQYSCHTLIITPPTYYDVREGTSKGISMNLEYIDIAKFLDYLPHVPNFQTIDQMYYALSRHTLLLIYSKINMN